MVTRNPKASLFARLWGNIQIGSPDKCWIWLKGKDADGYGSLAKPKHLRDNHSARNFKTHRLAYESAKGPIPLGMVVMHSCDNPSCCNPLHLSVGTPQENTADMHRKGRARFWQKEKTHCLRGHLFDDKNTYRDPRGNRGCRKCRQLLKKKRRVARLKAESDS